MKMQTITNSNSAAAYGTAIKENGKRKHEEFYHSVLQMVSNGQLRPGQRLPAERVWEKQFNVSRATISKAIMRLMSEGTVCSMTGRRGRFVSKNAAASGRESKYIKFISSMREQQPTLHHGSIEGVHDAIVDAGFEMVVGFASDFSDGDCQRLIGSDSGKCAGYIVWYNPLTFNNSFLEIIKTERVRVVFIDTCPSQIEASFVTTDNIDGTHQAVNHLVELGHHRITYVTPPTDRTTIRDRLTGFLRGSVENKLPLTDIDVVHVGWDFKGEAEKIAETIFSRQPRPTAIVACQDLLAIELEFALLRKGIKIPDDISLVGYDDIDKSGIMPVPLTTVKQDFYEMGRVAASILIDELEMRDGQLVHKVFLPARLIVRESVRRV